MRSKIIYILSGISLFLTVLTGCKDDSFIDENGQNIETVLRLSFIGDKPEIDATRSISELGGNELNISDLNVFIFNPNGSIQTQAYYSSFNTSVQITTLSGTRNICVVANMGYELPGVLNRNDLNTLLATTTTNEQMMNSQKNMIMAKETGSIVIPAPSTPGGSVSIQPILVERIYAKITTTFDYSGLNSGVTITPKKICLRQVPVNCLVFGSNTINSTSNIRFRGDSISFSGAVPWNSHDTATPLYMYENKQGDNGTNTAQSQKTPASGKTGLCSYLEVTTQYDSPTKSGTVVYRYYLGTNVLTNFDVKRNNWYQISISYNGTGGESENSWRVDVQGLKNKNLMSLPYYSGRCQVYYLGTGTTTINGLSSSNELAYQKNGHYYVMSKADLTGSSRWTWGNITVSGIVTDIIQRPKGDLELFLDVSGLHFPKNHSFGIKNYPITQYVYCFNKGNDVGLWYAKSNSSWLYIGDADQFSSFTAIGTASPTGFTQNSQTMVNNSGTFTSSAASKGIAVRCEANTGSERMGYITFHSATSGEEIARVFVTQNPSTYPKSPVALRYITGGVFMPGSYNSSGVLSLTTALNAPILNVPVYVSPFYMATTECKVQSFCDFLNDIGVTSNSYYSQALSALDKVGTYKDYPNSVAANTISSFIQNQTGPTNSGSLWIPSTRQITVNGSTVTLANGSTGNYPMHNISFYSSYDYGYWLHKYSGIFSNLNRNTNNGYVSALPTEMQWEAAARGITNGFKTLLAFTTSISTSKNGTFPYPFPDNNYNSGLLGTETNQLEILKAIAWCVNSNNWTTSSGHTLVQANGPLHPCGNLIPNSVGLFDMAGLIEEWVLDPYTLNAYSNFTLTAGVAVDPFYYIQLPTVNNRIYRGGCIDENPCNQNVGAHMSAPSDTYDFCIGFRPVMQITTLYHGAND